jgi:hypothetical protein
LGLETPWARWQINTITLIVGRQIEKNLQDGKPAFEEKQLAASGNQFVDPRQFKKVEKVRRKPDGTW